MKLKENYLGFALFLLAIIASVFTGGVMCMATPLEGGGVQNDDASTIGNNEDIVDDDFYQKDVDKKVAKVRPMTTPIDTISRSSESINKVKSMEVKYYAVGTKPIITTLKTAITAQTSGTTVTLTPNDAKMFTESDTIRVVGVSGYDSDGATVDTTNDLMLLVCGKDSTSGSPVVCAINGLDDDNGGTTYLPAIAAGTTLTRLGKACAEVDAQTGKFTALPSAETQYCQIFMTQIEQSTVDAMSAKEVDWSFSDLEEASIYDMKMGIENSFLFGVKGQLTNPVKDQKVWTTGGIYRMAGKDIEIGTTESEGNTTITDDQLVDFSKEIFTGVGVGSKKKVLFAGSEMVAAFAKIKSERYKLKENIEKWSMKFKSSDTNFGEVLLIHHEMFDMNQMSDCGLVIDTDFLRKHVFEPFSRTVLDLKKSGVRNSNAVMLREISALTLAVPSAHARVKLAAYVEPEVDEEEDSNDE